MEDYKVGNYLVDRLVELGLGHLFSIAGDYSIEWLRKYAGPQIEVIEEVNELNAGYAADGYARMKGIGALCTTYSAGSLCAVNAMAGAYVEKVPIVLINGAPSIKRVLTYEQTGYSSHHFISGRETDRQVFEYITAATARIDNPDLAPILIDYALVHCKTEKRPVYIELLEDVVDEECRRPEGELKCAKTLADPANLDQSVKIISEKLREAKNPILWVGAEIHRDGLQERVEKLIQQLNIPYVTDLLSKAVLSEEDPLFAGVFNGLASLKPVQDLVSNSDFILALGVWLTDINTLGWSPDNHRPDFDKTAFASLYTVKYGTYFSPEVPLGDLIDGLTKENITPKTSNKPKEAKSKQETGTNATLNLEDKITYQGFYDFVPKYIDKNYIVAADASLNYFGCMLLKVEMRGGFVAQPSYSAIGYVNAAATGLSLAKRDKRVMVFTGDGGFQMTVQCLSTQTRCGLNPIIFVIDNGVYGVEQWLANASVFSNDNDNRDFYKECVLHHWDYSKLAGVFGCKGWEVHTYKELDDAIREALANEKAPSVIQVVVPPMSIPDNARWKEQVDRAKSA